MDWLSAHIPAGSGIRIKSCTNTHTMIVIAGPKSRELLASVSARTGWKQSDFPWLTAQVIFIGYVEALAIAISYSGEQAFELHIPNEQLCAAYEILTSAGKSFGLSHFGMFAIDSMRIEKGYGHWKADLITEFNPLEAGVNRFVDREKEFPGKPGLLAQMGAGNRKELVTLELHCDTATAQPGEGVFSNGRAVGSITSASWGYRMNKNLAMAYVESALAAEGVELEVLLLGESTLATVRAPCLFDANNHIPQGLEF